MKAPLALLACSLLLIHSATAQYDGVRRTQILDYPDCVELFNDTTRVVVGWQVGGRILSYRFKGREALYLDPAESNWRFAQQKRVTAGRFDIGPEYLVPKRDALWSGQWRAEVLGPRHVRLVSAPESNTGVRLTREFLLAPASSRLSCRQIIFNSSDTTRHWCHWSRTFAKHGGTAVVPLDDHVKFPNGYVMYEGRGLINARPKDPHIVRLANFLLIQGVPRFPKLGFDSMAGWMAYQTPNDLLFVKRFPTFPDRAYNEIAGLTLSIWYPPSEKTNAVELEPIGPKNTITPGGRAEFTEHWELRERRAALPFTEAELQQLSERYGTHESGK